MKTDNLIDALVADRAAVRTRIPRALLAALALGGLVSLVVFLVDLGVRKDIGPALATWRFELKVVLVLLMLASAFRLCTSLARPTPPVSPLRRLLPVAALAAMAVAVELAVEPSSTWGTRLVGTNALVCLAAIPMLAAAPLATALWALRAGAPASPARAGAVAGLLAAATGATLYAFHCFDDSPLFVMTWYVLAAVPVILVGAVAGHRLLRW